ncbi:MAG: outer membrane beta-barrel protein [Bacteroidia bacterium]
MCSIFASASFAQTINGKIIDSLNAPVPFATIALLKAKDSLPVKGNITNDKGEYGFESVVPGNYMIKAFSVGYKETYSTAFTLDSAATYSVPDITLGTKEVNLNEVSVTVQKKLIEFKNGNVTVNVEGSPLAVGNSVYDLLTKMPGVTVDGETISIVGREGVKIMIDDRIQQISGQQLINLLKSMNASLVEKIEILKTPSVKNDAAGNGGMINIKTKKVKITGFSGSANVSYQQGFYANKDAGFSLNYRGRSATFFSAINFGDDQMQYTSIYKKTITYNSNTTLFDQRTVERSINQNASYNIGTDIYLNKKNTIGFRIDGSFGSATPYRRGNNYLSDNSAGYEILEFTSIRPNDWTYTNYNFNAEHLLDTLGSKIKFSADYSKSFDLYQGILENHFRDHDLNETLDQKIFKTHNSLNFSLYSAKLDLEKKFSNTFGIEAGVKENYQQMLSDFVFENKDPNTGIYNLDTNFSNVFAYNERVDAGYLNLQKQFKKIGVQFGLRGENTTVSAESRTSKVQFTRNYFQIFPVISFDYNPSETNSFQLSYNRRINRPQYNLFNPYKVFLNLLVTSVGNPYLMPEFSNTIEFTYGYKGSIYQSLTYYAVNNNIFYYPVQNDSTKETLHKISNLNDSKFNIGTYSIFIQKEIKKWWSVTFNGALNIYSFSGVIDGSVYAGSSLPFYLYINNRFIFPKKWTVEIGGFYGSRNLSGVYDNKERWALNVGVKKSILKEKLNISFGVNDIFYTQINRSSVSFQNQNTNLRSTFDSRRFTIGLSYSFGKVKIQQRKTKSNEDEKARLTH